MPVVATAVLGMQRSLAPISSARSPRPRRASRSRGRLRRTGRRDRPRRDRRIALFQDHTTASPDDVLRRRQGHGDRLYRCVRGASSACRLADTTNAARSRCSTRCSAPARSCSVEGTSSPLLQEAVVSPGWVGQQEFLAGYGLAQAMPGPLFTFSAYLGAIQEPSPTGVPGAALAVRCDLPALVPAARRRPPPVVVHPGACSCAGSPGRESAPPSSAFSPLRSGILL